MRKPQAERLLARLERHHRVGPGQWLAPCPAHTDLHLCLSVREAGDGTVLLRCWEGCGPAEITEAVGLGIGDLLPRLPSKKAS